MIWLFVFAVIGMTRIIINGKIMDPVDAFAERHLPRPLYEAIFECYQCCGFWCGVACGWMLFGWSPAIVFASGCAGSWLADFSETINEYCEPYADVYRRELERGFAREA
jgi:hypothetical protein